MSRRFSLVLLKVKCCAAHLRDIKVYMCGVLICSRNTHRTGLLNHHIKVSSLRRIKSKSVHDALCHYGPTLWKSSPHEQSVTMVSSVKGQLKKNIFISYLSGLIVLLSLSSYFNDNFLFCLQYLFIITANSYSEARWVHACHMKCAT